MPHVWIQEFVQRLETPSGKDQFVAHEFAAGLDEFPQIHLLIGVRSEIGVAALGCRGNVLRSVPEENGFA